MVNKLHQKSQLFAGKITLSQIPLKAGHFPQLKNLFCEISLQNTFPISGYSRLSQRYFETGGGRKIKYSKL